MKNADGPIVQVATVRKLQRKGWLLCYWTPHGYYPSLYPSGLVVMFHSKHQKSQVVITTYGKISQY
jgi:hypothetical protein